MHHPLKAQRRTSSLLAGLILLTSAAVQPALGANGINELRSPYSVKETVIRLKTELRIKGMKIFDVIDHQRGAKEAGLKMRPSTLVIFGNPKVGTHLMACSETVALDLPMKMLVYQDGRAQTRVAWNDVDYLVERHNIRNCPVTEKIRKALAHFASTATATERALR